MHDSDKESVQREREQKDKPRPEEKRTIYPIPGAFRRPKPSDPVARGKAVKPPKPGRWKESINRFLDVREKERQHERPKDECGRDRRKQEMPRPYLDATSNFAPQISALPVGQAGQVSFTVWNDGSYPAWTCYVDVYEGPGGYTNPLSAYKLRGRSIISLHPGERREISLPWLREQTTGRIVGIVYDPLLDPKDFLVVEQFNRHITSVHYMNLE